MGLSWRYDTLCLLNVGCVHYKVVKMSLKFCGAKLALQAFTLVPLAIQCVSEKIFSIFLFYLSIQVNKILL